MSDEILTEIIPDQYIGQRFDVVLAELWPIYSRSRLQRWVKQGCISLNGRIPAIREKVFGGETVVLTLPALETVNDSWSAQPIPLDVVFEDEHLIVINKPAGLVVHPGAGVEAGTLLNGLLHYAPELAAIPRAGIVHRLDKDTTGLLVIARSLLAHHALVEQLQNRTMHREYRAVVTGVMTGGATVDAPIGRHPVHRTKMAVVSNGKPAITHYRLEKRFQSHSYIRVQLESGRTHQIRVHMAYQGYPVVGDSLYVGRLRIPGGCGPRCKEAIRHFSRQALHAHQLALSHPLNQQAMSWQAPLPDDIQQLLQILQDDFLAQGESV